MRYLHRGRDVESEAVLSDESLRLGDLTVRYPDIDSARAHDYRVHLTLSTGETLELYHLGTKFEGFVEEFFEKRNAALAKELFLADRARIATFKGRFARPGTPPVDGRIDLFPRTLVFFPKSADPFFLRIAEITAVRANTQHYLVEVHADEIVTVHYLGLRFEEFQERLKRTRQAMERRCAKMLEALAPGTGALAPRMLDGNVIPLAEASRLEERICESAERLATFRHLKMVATGPLWIGIKEIGGDDLDELRDDSPVGRHLLWYYAPVGASSVHEVVSEEDHATYVYRAEIPKINRAWALIQFRRDVLVNPGKYPVAYRKLPHLREVADSLVGRAIHNDSWAAQLAKLTGR